MSDLTPYRRKVQRWNALKKERATFVTNWQKISRRINPKTARFLATDRNKASDDWSQILDNSTKGCFDTLAAGLMSGATSPARPWFEHGIYDDDLAKRDSMREWLSRETTESLTVLGDSNAYLAFHAMYNELALYGTAACYVSRDRKDVVRFHPLTAGEYCIAQNEFGVVDTIYREFDMTVENMVGKFGYAKCSDAVQRLYDQGHYDNWITVIHAIEPRKERDPSKRDKLNMPFRVCYFELGSDKETFLYEGGQDRFMAIVPRWDLLGGDIYGHGPGSVVVGDVGQLQHQQKAKTESIEFKRRPPVRLPNDMKNREHLMFPGGVVFSDSDVKATSIYQDTTDLNHLLLDIQDVRERIRRATYADLFLMFTGEERSGITATEIAERQQEKLQQLGPVMDRLQKEMFGPIIEIVFDLRAEAGLVAPPPEEIEGGLKIKYVSMMAQAQRAINSTKTTRWLGTVGAVVQLTGQPPVNVDWNALVEGEAVTLGVDPKYVLDEETVKRIQAQRQAQEQALQQAAIAEQTANTAQTLSQTPTQGDNALAGIMQQYTGR